MCTAGISLQQCPCTWDEKEMVSFGLTGKRTWINKMAQLPHGCYYLLVESTVMTNSDLQM